MRAWREEDGDAHFLPCAAFAGSRPGFAFLNGAKGLGYYRETWPGAAAMERGDLISPGDLQGCWVGCALCYVLWCANIRAVDADTCFGRRPLTARRGDPRLARYAHDFCCLVIPFKGREYRRKPGSNRFVWTVESGRNPANPEQDWERFSNKNFAVGAPGGARWLCRVC